MIFAPWWWRPAKTLFLYRVRGSCKFSLLSEHQKCTQFIMRPSTQSLIQSFPLTLTIPLTISIHRFTAHLGRQAGLPVTAPTRQSIYSRIARCRLPPPPPRYLHQDCPVSLPSTHLFLFEIAMSSSAFIILPSSAGNTTNVCAWWKVAVISTGHSNKGSRS